MDKLIHRTVLELVQNWLFKNKVIIIYGARQTGKTTICKNLIEKIGLESCKYFNCETIANRKIFENESLTEIINNFDGKKIAVIDEAQKVANIGSVLKQINDEYPEIQIIATGSSSFEPGNKLSEPLTGRSIKYTVYPLSVRELSSAFGFSELDQSLEEILRFGLYPGVFGKNLMEKKELLDILASDYLYKDVLNLEGIKKPALLEKILLALAFQIGSEVS